LQVMKTVSQQYIIGSPAVSMHEQAQLSVHGHATIRNLM